MREILFRGQTRRFGEKVRMGDGQKLPSIWVYGGILQGVGGHSIIYGGKNENNPSEGLDKWVVYSDTLGQYTGLTDKNGKKIFEGDIIQFHKFRYEPDWTGVISYERCQYVATGKMPLAYEKPITAEAFYCPFEVDVSGIDKATIKVIGNIHDNPELLNGHPTRDGDVNGSA